jgi:hypothetical protein
MLDVELDCRFVLLFYCFLCLIGPEEWVHDITNNAHILNLLLTFSDFSNYTLNAAASPMFSHTHAVGAGAAAGAEVRTIRRTVVKVRDCSFCCCHM